MAFTGRASRQQVPASASHCALKIPKPKPGHGKHSRSQSVGPGIVQGGPRSEVANGYTNPTANGVRRTTNRNVLPVIETYADPAGMEFSDATSSDWSLFTSSDEASFTTESTRDSFSTVDYADTCNVDPITSLFHSIYAPDYSRNSVSCGKFSCSKPQTRLVSQEKGHILNSYLSTHSLDRLP